MRGLSSEAFPEHYCSRDRPEFASLLEDIAFDERYLDPIGPVGKVFFWLDPKGAKTPLHRDLGNVFLVQVRGRKLWGDYAPTAGVPLFASRSEGSLSPGRRRPSLHRLRAGLRLGRTGTRPPRRR
ncbi:hypothetical protein [Ralstonia pseudosolanacearum]|uniref:hypothetical protein n=1 Tax=Ralstonia pseudosolanacearum TaxID=1310165 RepID=UPI002676819E|nr:hypothetical protein [Ralstonia pseudosolanacearum]MDO3505966.1 hypothetical protein [Ralstonia pseudosolanacearum]MDO3510298.1 hypothetical protein [Ralstonia pseudosolanacearum]MDO3536038.1 hypothetical protein [Ralstonia pseudosolanacearum]MDO3605283.1 hypothetical protein [Ralstonia pseudosolanacearum]MDO3611054.1 hypothetical protein [Ralstonia pseudosolanacearum]